MATEDTGPSWTAEEEALAKKIAEEAKNYSGSFFQRYGPAAKAFGYFSYAHLPQGTKSYISTDGGKKSHSKTMTKAAPLSSTKGGTPTAETWYTEVAGSKSLQHGLHPKDEASLIQFFQEASHQ